MGHLGSAICVLVLGASFVVGQTAGGPGPPYQRKPQGQPEESVTGSPPREQDGRLSDTAKDGGDVGLVAELPDSPSSYVPLSNRQKFDIFLKSTYEPYTFFSAGFEATLAQAEGRWYGYGGGIPGWGKRFGASLADTEARKFIQSFVLASLLNQDPRYLRSSAKSPVARAWYAATRVFVTRTDDGNESFNTSEFLGALFVTSLQNSYYPERERGAKHTADRFLSALGSDASANLLREFWPDLTRLFRKHAPEKIKKLEEKLPDPIEKVAKPN
jgi:hypothetical protein